jgi:NADH-quinone oxidoreductase subunit H
MANTDHWVGFDTHIPWWLLVVIKAVAVFAILVVLTLFNIWFERKVVVSWMQMRIGPNRVGPQGTAAVARRRREAGAQGGHHPGQRRQAGLLVLAPVISVVPAFLAFAVIPFGPSVSIFGTHTTLQLTDLPVGVLYILAVSSIGIYGIVLAGWASGSTYPLLGGCARPPR